MNFIRLFSQSLIGLALLGAAVLAQSATAETIIGRSHNVRAELSYDKPEEYQYKNVRLKIFRAGETVFDQQIQSESDYDIPIGSLFEENKLPLADLDGDKEPEVIADFFTGGAHCCTYSLIYRYDQQAKRYTKIRHEWGNGGYRLRDLDQDGLQEFNSRDDRFAYAFDAYAASGYPPQIWQYRQGKMIDVTRRYPKLVYDQTFYLWRTYTEEQQKGNQLKGYLAA